MESGIESFKDFTEVASDIITIVSLVMIVVAYIVSRKQIYFATISKCINDFRALKLDRNTQDQDLVWKYIDLVNEELFYLEKGYLPLSVGIEWIDGMIDWMPIFDSRYHIKNSNFCIQLYCHAQNEEVRILNFEFFRDYPRVLKAFCINNVHVIEWDKVYGDIYEDRKKERDKLIQKILNNLDLSWDKKLIMNSEISKR